MANAWPFVSNTLKFHSLSFNIWMFMTQICPISKVIKLMHDTFVSNSLQFHLFHVISECSDSNLSKVILWLMHDHFVSNSLKFQNVHAISECSDSNMSKSKVI